MKRFFLIFFAICAASTAFAGTFRRVSAPQADWTGEYALVFESADSSRVFSGVDAAMGSEVVDITNNVISDYTGPTLVVAALADGGYSIAVSGGANDGKFISSGISAPSYSNALKFNTTPHRVDLDYVNGSVLMSQTCVNNGVDTLVTMRFNDNENQKRFRFYKVGQLPVQLYKLEQGTGSDTATQTINTIAEIKTMEDGAAVRLAGVVTHVYNKNVYIQDATGGMLLYFVIAPSLSVGDEVVISGSKTTYGGAPEVQYSLVESVISTGNTVNAPTFATLADACQEANMFTLVNVNNLEIVSLDSYNNPTVSDGTTTVLCYRMAVDTAVFKVGTHVDVTAVLGYYNGYQFVGNVAGIQLAQDTVPGEQPTSVTFNVIVPANTPDCYIAGNFNNWTHQQMTKLTDSTYTYVYSAANLVVELLEYKYCAGPDWAYVEKDSIGWEIPNRSWQALDRVATWLAVPQDTVPQDTVPGEQLTSVTFNVIVPANTPDCYIAGSFNNWTHQQMTKVTANSYTLTIDSVLLSTLEYKYCAGPDWAYVEVDADGYHVMNRSWQAQDRVAMWLAIPQDTVPTDDIMTIAQVKALENNTETQVEGVVTFINGRNVYVQDATGGLLLYMKANPTFNVGDKVVVSGTKVLYGGAPELKNGEEVSAVADSIPAAASFATLADACQEANMFTLVNVNNLEIVSLDSYNNPTVSDGTTTLLCYRMQVDTAVFKVSSHVDVTAVLGYYNGYQFVGNAAGIQLAQDTVPQDTVPSEQPTSVTFNVIVPANTPDCYIAGNFNNWTHQQMTKLTDSTYTYVYSAVNLIIDSLEYKYCAGNGWEYVEKDSLGWEIPNRRWQALDRVATWLAVPQDTIPQDTVPGEQLTSVTFNVIVPANTPDCYIAGNFNNWTHQQMTKVNDVTYTFTLNTSMAVDSIEYKYCSAADWAYVETDAYGYDVPNRHWQAQDVVAAWMGTDVDPTNTVVFNVTVPQNTPDCYIAGNFNGWTHQQMTKVDDVTYTFTLNTTLAVDSIRYKYCAGDGWAYVEKDANGNDVPDRIWQAQDVVAAWANTILVDNGLHYEMIDDYSVRVIGFSNEGDEGNYLGLTNVVIPDTVIFNFTRYNVTEVDDYAFMGCATMTSLEVGANVEKMGMGAFYLCTNLSSVVWNAKDCQAIQTEGSVYPMFSTTDSITSFTFGSSVEVVPAALCAFMWQLQTLTIPAGVWGIDAFAFYGCSSLQSITLPSTLTVLGKSAFTGCEALTKTNFTGTLKQWCEMAVSAGGAPTVFSRNLYLNDVLLTHADIPEGTTLVNDWAFAYDTCLVSVKVPNSVSYLGRYSFYACPNLETIEVGNGVTELAVNEDGINYTFGEGRDLTKFVYRSSVADDFNMGETWDYTPEVDTLIVPAGMINNTWYGLNVLRYVEIIDGEFCNAAPYLLKSNASTLGTINLAGATNTMLEDKAFYELYKLTNLSLPQNLQTIPYKMAADCYMLENIVIPSSVTSIGNNAFENCRSLDSVDFGTTTALQQIGNWAFYNCHNLPTLTIPEGVTYVGDGAFYGCSYLTELTLPSTMLTMGDNSFALCSRLQKMNVSAAIPPTIASKTFKDVLRSIPVYVPMASVELYKTDEYWREFNIIGGEEQESAVDNISSEGTTKIYRDGQVLIYHNGKCYDMMGNLVE